MSVTTTSPVAPELPAPAPSLDEDDTTRAPWERALGWAIVGACVLVVLGILHPGDLLKNTTTNGGDMGAHVWWPWFLEHHWFPKLRLSGWAPDWYAGFPVGQYYFPMPAVLIAIVDIVLPYNVAFKLVTASGPILLPAAAYVFARGIKTPWPAPPAFAVAALGTLVQTRNDWQIYGGNIASTLAGEFSFTLGLALGLFGLGALAYTLDTGKRRWLPAVLIASAVLCHIVIAMFIGIAAAFLWIVRRPKRTWPLAVSVGGASVALTAVWSLPLVAQQAYTQSMRYTKLIPKGDFSLPSWVWLPGPIKRTVEGIVRGVGVPGLDASGKRMSPTLWLPWWIWLLAGFAIVAAGWYRRRSTLVLLLLAVVFGVLFVEWPEHAVWNTRFLPFWLLVWGFLAAMGAAELCRLVASGARGAYAWIRDGDLQDGRARAWALRVRDEELSFAERQEAEHVLLSRQFDRAPEGWEPPPSLQRAHLARVGHIVATTVLAFVVIVAGAFAVHRAWDARAHNPSVAISGWATWNYEGYESKPAWPEYHNIMTTMGKLPAGRVLWEPSSMQGDPINLYGTSLALELLPYWTKGKISSMEGLYFESSATTSFHFLTVAECSKHPSNPVRGLAYGTLDDDFDLCVRHLQMLGVRYLMLWTSEAEAKADRHPDLHLVRTIPDLDGQDPKGWKVYEVANAPLVEGMSFEPVVAKVHAGTYGQCWHKEWPDPSTAQPRLGAWECSAGAWWRDRDVLDKPWAASGPGNWQRIDVRDLARTQPKPIAPVHVTRVRESVDRIAFHVSEVGKPVVVKTSYFPNWESHGAAGPYRLAPNLMVVVPTSSDVTLTYGLTGVDWLGRLITFGGLVGLVLLVRWKGAARFAAVRADGDAGATTAPGEGGPDEGGPDEGGPDEGGDGDVVPPDRTEPAPALP